MDPTVFMGYHARGIAGVLNSFGLSNTPPHVKIYVMEPNVFMGYPKKGIACPLSILLYELEYNMH
jgi:hypothetical protein